MHATTTRPRADRGRRARTADRRRVILRAALDLFAERGLARTSVDDIRAASGASVGSIYHHFGSKEGVAAALYAEAIADYQEGARAVIESAPDAEAGIRGTVTHFLEWIGQHPAQAGLMLDGQYSDVRRLAADEVGALNRDYFLARRRWADDRIAAGELRPVPADVFVWAVLGPAWRFATLWLRGRTTTTLDEAARHFSDLAWSGVGDPGPGGEG